MKYDENVYERLPSWLAGNYYLLYATGIGKFLRFCGLLLMVGMFALINPVLAGICMAMAFWLVAKTLFTHVWGMYRFFHGATPSQLVRSYNKSWQSVQNGPIQKITKVPHSRNTP